MVIIARASESVSSSPWSCDASASAAPQCRSYAGRLWRSDSSDSSSTKAEALFVFGFAGLSQKQVLTDSRKMVAPLRYALSISG